MKSFINRIQQIRKSSSWDPNQRGLVALGNRHQYKTIEKQLGKQAKGIPWSSSMCGAHEARHKGAWDNKKSCLMRRGAWDSSSSANFAAFRPIFDCSFVLKCFGIEMNFLHLVLSSTTF
jgi:hypothetical protein